MIPAKKTLGQNFLRSPRALSDIITAANPQTTDHILEAGPGEGVLTELLLKSGATVVAVEKDARLIPVLREKFSSEISAGKFTLIEGDILEVDLSSLIHDSPYKIVANIPYYITGQFFRKFLSGHPQPTQMVILVQKEVADRIVAHDGKESILSISVKAYGTPRRVAVVKAGSFVPAPSVDSAIISIEGISRQRFTATGVSEKLFFGLLKKGFNQKRKMLSHTLAVPKDALLKCGVEGNARPEEVSVEQWLCLTTRRV